jgi:protease I
MTAEIKAEHVAPEDYNAIIITSLNSSTKIKNNSPIISLLQRMDAYGKLIAAVCYGPKLLISANIVMGRRITSSYLLSSELKNAGAKWIDESVVKDNNIITSGKIADLSVFNLRIIETLGLLNNNRYQIAEKQEFNE